MLEIIPAMAAFIYRCPRAGLKVQGWIVDGPTEADFPISVDCPICNSVHLVDPVVENRPETHSDQGRSPMTTQVGNKGGFANNLPAQLGLLAVAVVVLLILAWRYMW